MAKIQDVLARNEELAEHVIGPASDEIDRLQQFPRKNIEALGQAGVLGLMVPEQYEGLNGGLTELVHSLEVLARRCPSTAMVVLMHHCATAVITARGSESLKRNVLPAIVQGKRLSTLAFSEAGSGGHFYMPVSQVSQNGSSCRVSAFKSFVTSAGEADTYVVSTRGANAANPTELDLYLVDKNTKGLTTQGRFEGLGLRGNASAPMKLESVAVSEDIRLGSEGTGFEAMLEVVLPHFQIGLASICVGLANAAFQVATTHVSKRKYEHADASLAAIPRVQFLVAEMALELNGVRAYLTETIRKALVGSPDAMIDILGVKVKAAEGLLAVTSRAMMLGGGSAFGKQGGLERIFRDSQAAAVMAPSSDVLKEFVGKACLGLPLF